ncbi:hypothetical protein D5R81_12855 [Parashewanella spongiae]|uniref:Uncharacterized protein n=1 Tax=Parashewanella spongiae TaxID=342950 RepID=A0A3A6TT43_9GAMM|nr:hypothetical protein [Parashewanella spongiae]MCL1078814.1 hypothetical protein [Parashewanella spongiae]RJY11906.1 hypothetical protein D5R81_12855 [Parashewanella spongiae]
MKTLLLLTSIFASQSVLALTTEDAITQTDAAMNTMNMAQLQQLASETMDYANAYANYRLGVGASLVGNGALAKEALTQAASVLETLNQQQDDAENYALLSAVYGMHIFVDRTTYQELGPKSNHALQQAEELEPNNPRVQLVKAIANYYKPNKSIEYINQALNDFELPCEIICWGKSESFVWRGLAQQQKGDLTAAKQDWQQALVVNPTNGWAKSLLQQF